MDGFCYKLFQKEFKKLNFSYHLRKILLSLIDMFHLLKFLSWCGKNYCNYSKYFSSNFSVLFWKYFVSGLDIFGFWCRYLLSLMNFFLSLVCKFFCSGVEILRSYCRIGLKTKNVRTRDEKFPHQRRKISTPETKYFHTSFVSFRSCRAGPRVY